MAFRGAYDDIDGIVVRTLQFGCALLREYGFLRRF